MTKDHPLLPWCLGVLVALVSCTMLLGGPAWGAAGVLSQAQLQEAYGKLPLHFIHNQGQMDARVKYYAHGGGSAFFFTRQGVVLSLEGNRDQSMRGRTPDQEIAPRQPTRPLPGKKTVVQLTPVGMSPEAGIIATDLQGGRFNYFIGNDPGKWRTDIPTYGAVLYQESYPGIDVKFYGNGRQLEYDLIVRPGADPARIKFQYQGIKDLDVTREGNLAIRLPDGGSLIQKKPLVYQEISGHRVAREGKFKVLENTAQFIYGFEVASYDPQYPLVIDPTLEYSSYLGGGSFDVGNGIAVDSFGCAYVTGYTYSGDFPLTDDLIFDHSRISSAVFVTKVNPTGTQLLYSTLVGGDYDNYGNAIAVDSSDCAYVAGGTRASNFPLQYPYQDEFKAGSWDAFVFKLSADGKELKYSTYLGGTGLDIARGIGVGVNGQDVFLTGKTFSTDFPTTNSSKNGGGGDAFITSLRFDGSSLSLNYSTYLGGSGDDAGNGIAVDSSGNAYVAGETSSKNFFTTFQAGRTGNNDAFVTKFGSDGIRQYSVRLGGSKYDWAQAVAVDSIGCAYVTGYTYSGTGFPTTNAVQSAGVPASQVTAGDKKVSAAAKGGGSQAYTDVFVTKINAAGNHLDYSVCLGGSQDDVGYGIAVDGTGCAYVTGGTYSADFLPVLTPLIGNGGSRAVFVIKLNPNATMALSSASLDGDNAEIGFAIAVDNLGHAYVTGYTYSTNFSLLDKLPFQGTLNRDPSNVGVYDAFVAKIIP